jgi:WD40 repeat protein
MKPVYLFIRLYYNSPFQSLVRIPHRQSSLTSQNPKMENFAAVKDNLLVTSCYSKQQGLLSIWDGTTHAYLGGLGELRGNTGKVICAKFSPDNTKLATIAGEPGILTVWNVEKLNVIIVIKLDDPIFSLCFHSNGNELLGKDKSFINTWDLSDSPQTLVKIPAASKVPHCFCLSWDNSVIFASGLNAAKEECLLKSWDYESRQELSNFQFPQGLHQVAACPSDHDEVAISFSDGRIIIFMVATGSVRYDMPLQGLLVPVLKYNSDGTILVTCTVDGIARILDTSNWAIRCISCVAGRVSTFSLNFEETKLALVDETGVRIVDLDSAVPTHIIAGETSCGLCWANRPLLVLM